MNKRISKIVLAIKNMPDLVDIFQNEITKLNNHYQLTFPGGQFTTRSYI
jgi:hypothetical protein